MGGLSVYTLYKSTGFLDYVVSIAVCERLFHYNQCGVSTEAPCALRGLSFRCITRFTPVYVQLIPPRDGAGT